MPVIIFLGIFFGFSMGLMYDHGETVGRKHQIDTLVKVCMDKNPKMAHTEVKNYCLEYIGEKTK